MGIFSSSRSASEQIKHLDNKVEKALGRGDFGKALRLGAKHETAVIDLENRTGQPVSDSGLVGW